MTRILLIILCGFIYSNSVAQVIADHSVVDLYDDIPQRWIDSVKTMWVSYAGESHSQGIMKGLNDLEDIDATYSVATKTFREGGAPDPYTDQNLRASTSMYIGSGWSYIIGERQWFTNNYYIELVKDGLDYTHANGPELSAVGFGWCWDATQGDPSEDVDPVYGVRWYGRSNSGPEGDRSWGLDENDYAITGNTVNINSYLSATQSYIDHCSANGIPTTVFFTTGPVDDYNGSISTEALYQGHLKFEAIRDYVKTNGGYLFDYADILCYDDDATEPETATWNGNVFPTITANNAINQYTHVSHAANIRLAKALWWLLARIAGWDGTVGGEDTSPPSVPIGLLVNSATLNSITFSWSASSDNIAVTGYNVYRNGTFIGTTSLLSYTDNTLTECNQYNYTVSAFDGAGNESGQSQGLLASNCHPDLTPTLIVSPNISHGITAFNVIVRITELNNVNSDGPITLNIPADARWDLEEGYNLSLAMLNDMTLNNSDWTYSRDGTNHIFTSSVVIPAGNSSTFGFTIVFNPDTSRGLYTVTSQLVPGSGGEFRSSNNADSERLDYFQ